MVNSEEKVLEHFAKEWVKTYSFHELKQFHKYSQNKGNSFISKVAKRAIEIWNNTPVDFPK